MGDKRSRIPIEEAKQHDKPLGGAPPMASPGQQQIPMQQPTQGYPIQPGQGYPGMVYQPQMQQGQPIPGYMPQSGYQMPPGQGMPVNQFVQQAASPNQPQRRPKEAVQADLAALGSAVKREAEKQAATPPTVQDEEKEHIEISSDDAKEDDNLFLGSMDAEMDSAIDKFNNARRRKRIEKNLPEMRVEDMVEHGELRQKVRIAAGLTVEYRTTSGQENQSILHELGELEGSEIYLRERLALMNLTAGLRMVGNEVLPDHLVDDDFDVEAFNKKFRRVLRYPVQILADMRVNYFWFDDRVRNVMIAEELGNG